ncbi:MAG: hypothetical protein PWQ31_1240, partial [Eubacteriales bacterium]|nr:hypothetical protein [Eubacteriales bacterium]
RRINVFFGIYLPEYYSYEEEKRETRRILSMGI